MNKSCFSRVEKQDESGRKYYFYELNYTSDMTSGLMTINLLVRSHAKDIINMDEAKMICDWVQDEIKRVSSLTIKLDLYSLYDVLYYGYHCPQSDLKELSSMISSYKRAFVYELQLNMRW